ncbi:hypothetical protein PAPYR_2156 [Paratrimastix pyriformis]|uniref:ELMO domain-containing protein n=1 Tax=Paratrimastix pyriformis TaxID=342808 RepID=A0ABQ8UQY5_9EUKA|nr:hypothetical protein PAPYR_2156 [Paratrimastix pyriformis]
MGILGLDQLVRFADRHPEAARACLALSTSMGEAWFPWAITGIAVSSTLVGPCGRAGWTCSWPGTHPAATLTPSGSRTGRTGLLYTYDDPQLPGRLAALRELFDELYCWAWCNWTLHWLSSAPKSPMDFWSRWTQFLQGTFEPALSRATLAPPVMPEPFQAPPSPFGDHVMAAQRKGAADRTAAHAAAAESRAHAD